ncbi:MAG: InlB B-repeat-containing protein, partial [Clostridiales bacterium]|nr:InlB B-repeat-containing protein [Clostridiales bacterium]
TDFSVNRAAADASGNLTGSSDSEFVYNSPVGNSLASMSGTIQTKNGRTYIEGGTYLMLYFGADGEQYYALDVTITTSAAVDFELIARVSDMDRRNAFAEGCGEPYGYYLGGVFSGVDMWDPRAAALLTKNGEYSETSESLTYNDGGVDKTYHGPSAIDVTLTIDLRAQFDRVKLYRLDETGTRQGGKPTLYFVPQNIQKSYATKAEEGQVLYDEQLNTIVLSPGKYELHFFGNVTYKSNSAYWFNRSTGELGSSDGGGTVVDIEGKSGPQYVAIDNWNGVVENLFIKRLDDEDDDAVEVTFDAKGGTLTGEEKVSVNWGEKLEKPTDPTNGDKTFVGWYTDSACTVEFDFDKPVTVLEDFTLYAKWLDAAVVKHTVTFHYNYTGAPNDVFKTIANVENGTTITKPSPGPTRTGYTFDGWYMEESCTNAWEFSTQAVTADTKDLYAKWTAEKYIIKFNLNGLPNTTAPEDAEVAYNEEVGVPTVEVPEHYTIEGWYTTAACTGTAYDFSTKVTAGGTLYAKWYAENGVYYDDVYARGLEKNTGNSDGTEYMALGVPQTKADGAVAIVWYDGSKCKIKAGTGFAALNATEATLAKGVYNFYYKFDSSDDGLWIALSNYIIDFNANEGTLTGDESYVYTEAVKTNGEGTLSTFVADPTRTGYRFDGWYTAASGGNKVTATSNNTFSASTTLYAHWVQQFTVTFNATAGSSWSDGTIEQEQKVDENTIAEALVGPQNAPSDDLMFDCWSESNTTSGGSAFDFTLPINRDVTLYAQWKDKPNETVKVTFDANGGTCDPESVDVPLGGTLTNIPAATRPNYDFDGWYTAASDGDPITAATTFNAPQTIYAHWVRTYTVTFNVNGGSGSVDAQTVRTGLKASLPDAEPTRSEYTFAGWYKDTNGSQKYDFDTAITGDITLYAKWYYSTLRANTYYIVGGMNGWGATVGYNLIENTAKASNLKSEYVIYGLELSKDDEFKIVLNNTDGSASVTWKTFANESTDTISGSTSMSDNNFKVLASGTYNVFIHNYNDNNNWWAISVQKVE